MNVVVPQFSVSGAVRQHWSGLGSLGNGPSELPKEPSALFTSSFPLPAAQGACLTHVWPLQHVVRVKRRRKSKKRRKKKKVGEG